MGLCAVQDGITAAGGGESIDGEAPNAAETGRAGCGASWRVSVSRTPSPPTAPPSGGQKEAPGRGPNPILWAYGKTALRPLCPVHEVELEEPWLRCPRCDERASGEIE